MFVVTWATEATLVMADRPTVTRSLLSFEPPHSIVRAVTIADSEEVKVMPVQAWTGVRLGESKSVEITVVNSVSLVIINFLKNAIKSKNWNWSDATMTQSKRKRAVVQEQYLYSYHTRFLSKLRLFIHQSCDDVCL